MTNQTLFTIDEDKVFQWTEMQAAIADLRERNRKLYEAACTMLDCYWREDVGADHENTSSGPMQRVRQLIHEERAHRERETDSCKPSSSSD